MSAQTQGLQDVEPGQKVLKWWYDQASEARVERTTATQVILTTGERYSKETGKRIGGYASSGRDYIAPYDPTVIRMQAIEQRKRREINKLQNGILWKEISDTAREQIVVILMDEGIEF